MHDITQLWGMCIIKKEQLQVTALIIIIRAADFND